VCTGCPACYPVTRGIPRFVEPENYAANFGRQWNEFRRTQLDSHSGVPISRDRFLHYTGFTRAIMEGRTVLDAGCGAGRFAEIALGLGAHVVAIDYSNAIDAARDNLGDDAQIDFVQADIARLPFADGAFSAAFSLGVLQHTPDPAESFASLARKVAVGGKLAVDVYPATWKNAFFAKYWLRPFMKSLPPERTRALVDRWFERLYAASRGLRAIPLLGHYMSYMVPVANYNGVYPLQPSQQREWALLDTYDMWAPAFDQPQTTGTLRRWFERAGFGNVEVFRSGFNVGRGVKAAA